MADMKDIIRQKMKAGLNIHWMEVVDESPRHQVSPGVQSHFRIVIVSRDFKGLSPVERHQKVYQILSEELKNSIHALAQKTFSIEEWEKALNPPAPSPPCQKKL